MQSSRDILKSLNIVLTRALHHGKKWKWETRFGKPKSKSDPERFDYIFLMQIASTFK